MISSYDAVKYNTSEQVTKDYLFKKNSFQPETIWNHSQWNY
jgi:hypothetical protein